MDHLVKNYIDTWKQFQEIRNNLNLFPGFKNIVLISFESKLINTLEDIDKYLEQR